MWIIWMLVAVSLGLVCLGLLLGPKFPSSEKLSEFECGFTPFQSNRETVQIRFFLIGLLFVIFDLEVALIVPFGLVISKLKLNLLYTYWYAIFFVLILTLGLVFEWMKGALDWE